MKSQLTRPCVQEPCQCGGCYQPHSVVGDWLAARWRWMGAVAQVRILRRPQRRGRHGELLLPVWVHQMFRDDI